jgi:carboxyl-terminal processing protease
MPTPFQGLGTWGTAYLGLKPQALCLRPFGASPAQDFSALGKEIVELVRDHFMDAEKATRWAERHAGYAEGIRDRSAFRDATRQILAELETSHTQYYIPEDPGYYDLLAIFEPFLKRDPKTESVGLATADGFVVRAFAGGPAAAAGLRRGDRIVSQTREGTEVVLEVQSRRDGPSRTVRLTPRLISPKEEWLEHQRAGSRVIEHKGRRIAYAPLWSCAGEEHQDLLEEALQGDLAEADALVIDFRGGWGGCNTTFVQLFDPAAPDLTRIERDGKRTTYSASWRKPLAILIDGGTRSGKEMVSQALQRSKRATLVGERTAGAVVAGRINLLSDGSLVFLAVHDIEVEGERLEGVGVKPDVEVPAGLEFAEGRDPQLERALDLLSHS